MAAVILTDRDLTDLANVVMTTTDHDWIRTVNRTMVGSEALRLIVRDNICGAADAVSNALWIGLS